MGLILQPSAIPGPRRLDEAHHRLPAGMHVNVLHRHLLLATAALTLVPDLLVALLERSLGIVERVRNAVVRRRQPVGHSIDGPTPAGMAQDHISMDAANDAFVIDDV